MGCSRDPGEPLSAGALWTPCRECVCGILLHLSKSPRVVIKLTVVQELDPAASPQCVSICVCLSIKQSSLPASSMCLFPDREINGGVDRSVLCVRCAKAR